MKQWDRPFWAIIALTLVVISCVILLTDRGTVENDAIQALSVARNILRGNGIATDIVYYPRHIQQDRIPAYQTTFPPGHPVLVAAVAAVTGWTVESAALLLCSVSFAVITPLLFVLLRNASGKPFTSFLLSLLWLSLSEAWISVALLNTDIVFIAFTVLSAMCLYLGERANWDKQNSAQDLMWCVLAGVFAGLAFSVRSPVSTAAPVEFPKKSTPSTDKRPRAAETSEVPLEVEKQGDRQALSSSHRTKSRHVR